VGLTIVIIGGGVTGAYSAYFAARAGAEVIVVERDELAAHASGHNAGGLNPLHGSGIPEPLGDLALQSLHLHLEHWERIGGLSGAGRGPDRVDRLDVAGDAAEAEALRARAALYNQATGFSAQWLDTDALRALEPRMSADVAGALHSQGNHRVDARHHTRAVFDAAGALGTRFVRGAARGLRSAGGRVTGVMLDAQTLSCDAVVIAPGPWCREASAWLGIELAIEPIKGEMLVAEIDGGPPAADIGCGPLGVYGIDGDRVLLGGTEGRAGWDETPSAAAREQILAGIAWLAPGLGEPRVLGQWAGLRPMTADGLPIVGIAPGWENACVATGAGRKGMLFSAGLGRAAVQLLMTGATDLAVGACAPGRTAVRA